jgi:hypothetical protein
VQTWLRRGWRLWLALFLPAILLCFWLARSHYAEEQLLRAQRNECANEASACPKNEWSLIKRDQDQSLFWLDSAANKSRDSFELYLLVGLCLASTPLVVWFFAHLFRWVWLGSREKK